MNKVILSGRLTQEPQFMKASDGLSIINLTLAVKNKFDKEKPNYIRCCAYKFIADYINQYVNQGDMIEVEGRLQVRNYKDNDNKNRTVTEVIVESVDIIMKKLNKEKLNDIVNGNQDFESTVNISPDDLPF